jgi:hypothetical protein
MANLIGQIATQLPQQTLPEDLYAAGEKLRALIDEKAYVGEVVSLGYSDAIVQIHDFHRQQVGGIPALCFLLASRISPQATPDATKEDASVILLRVMGSRGPAKCRGSKTGPRRERSTRQRRSRCQLG